MARARKLIEAKVGGRLKRRNVFAQPQLLVQRILGADLSVQQETGRHGPGDYRTEGPAITVDQGSRGQGPVRSVSAKGDLHFVQELLGPWKQQAQQGWFTLRESTHGPGQTEEKRHGGLAEGNWGHRAGLAIRLDQIRQCVQGLHLIGYNCIATSWAAHRYVAQDGVQAKGKLLGRRKTWKSINNKYLCKGGA